METCTWVLDPEAKPQKQCGDRAVVFLAIVGVVMPPGADGFFACSAHEEPAYEWSKSNYGAMHIEGVDLRGN